MRLALVLYFVALLMQMNSCNGCIHMERMALLDIKAYFVSQIGDAADTELVSWVDDRDSNCCSWNRVICRNVLTGHVTDLFLNNQLKGPDHDWLSDPTLTLNISLLSPFQELVTLDLSRNNFNNWIHNEGFSNLKKLEALDLSMNILNTSILLSLNGLTSLRTLNLNQSGLDGSFPAEGFSSLKKLETLDISGNGLNTSILPSLIGLTSLRSLNLGSNNMEGPFPGQGFSNLKKLENLDLSWNHINRKDLSSLNVLASLRTLKLNHNYEIYGSFEAGDFVHFSRLELLELFDTGLNGTLNTEGFQKMKNLKVLDLSYNQMVGSIQGLCKMKSLVELVLSGNMFGGKLPECLHNLTSLRILDLSNNLFNGNFPSFTANLTSLAYLSLTGNYLQGSFSLSTLANHSKLQVLAISSQNPGAQIETEKTSWLPKFQLKFLFLQSCNLNKDKGSVIPSFLLYQYDLQFIDLSDNKLVGEFPSWLISNNTRIQVIRLRNNLFVGIFHLFSIRHELYYLDISNNNISGVLQKDVGNLLPKMWIMNMSMNTFEGNIQTSIGEMKELEYLDLSHNNFSGELPEYLIRDCIKLGQLTLSRNFLQGNISNSVNGSTLQELYLNDNNFNGTLEGILKNNTQLLVLDISNNLISGAIPSSIGNFSLRIFLVADNQIEGEIPFEFSNMSSLEMLDLSQNRLFGSVPHFNMPNLCFLYLQKNALTGFLPHTLSESSKLVTLDLRDNQLSGDIPHWINKLSKLRVLLLGGNNFRGHIPIQLCQLTSVTIMDLSRNKIIGSIPYCFKNLSFEMGIRDDEYGPTFDVTNSYVAREYDVQSLVNASVKLFIAYSLSIVEDEQANVEFRTKHNFYSYKGDILEYMSGLDLSCNMLTGIIPGYIGNLQQLHALNLSNNYFTGSIPMSFSNLTQIESLDLSYNNLSGQIPSQLTQLHFLSTFNVSYNNLSGITPSAGQFGTFDEDNYRGNPNLCGPLLKNKCKDPAALPPTQSNETRRKETTLDMVAFWSTFGAAYVTMLLVFIVLLCINVGWRMAWFNYMGKLIRLCFPSFPLY